MIATAVSSVIADGPAAGCRALDLRVWGGVDIRLLPDRGLDCGAAWFAGVPLAWISAVGETAPLDRPRDMDWQRAFGGGLVTTCGLRNVGAPSEGHGLHGEISHRRASDVRWERREVGDAVELVVHGVLMEGDALDTHLELEREWRVRTGEGVVALCDVTRNRGGHSEPAPLLYHVNLGAPLWAPGARVAATADGIAPRDADAAAYVDAWDRAPEHEPGAPERVYEHALTPAADGWAQVVVTQPAIDLEVIVRWDARALPRLHQWVHPGVGALGVEPANCGVLGRAEDRAAGRLPVLEPGEERVTRLEIRAQPRSTSNATSSA